MEIRPPPARTEIGALACYGAMLTSTERSRKYRERLKNEEKKLAQYREKDRKRKAREYKRQKESLSDAKKAW